MNKNLVMQRVVTVPQVSSMICHRDVELGLKCLGSLIRFCREPVEIVLHDDGSVTQEDSERLLAGIEGVRLISKAESDDVVEHQLKNHPRCAAFRKRSPMGMKLVDAGLMLRGDIVLCDTDILFVRPFCGAFEFPSDDIGALHLLDYADSFCWRPWEKKGIQLCHRFNAGFMMMRRQHFDLDLMEFLVETIETSNGYRNNQAYQWFLEQTCWSIVAGKLKTMRWDPVQLRVIGPVDKFNCDFVGGHFVGSVRHMLEPYRLHALDVGLDHLSEPVTISFKESEKYSLKTYGKNRLMNRFRATVGAIR
jgi:hypothetical protein